MNQELARKHTAAVLLLHDLVSTFAQKTILLTKAQLLHIVGIGSHPEAKEYLAYIQNILLADCRDDDTLTEDIEGTLRFPIKRNRAGEVTEYHYIT
ncbi:MAG: hypothetical protein RLZZ223_154 [Candidatus Parcubacteria bacterium]